jgi:hypothetical protein
MPWIILHNIIITEAHIPICEYSGSINIIKQELPIKNVVRKIVFFLPMLSPSQPNKRPPKGLKIKLVQKVKAEIIDAENGSVGGKKRGFSITAR